MTAAVSRTEALLSLVRRELERRPWLETEHHLGVLTVIVKFERDGTPNRCLIRTEGECAV